MSSPLPVLQPSAGLPGIDRPLDNTALQAYMACPREYYFSMMLHRRGGGLSPSLTYGKAWHLALELRYKGAAREAVEFMVRSKWEDHGAAGDYRTIERLLLDYKRYCDHWGETPEAEAARGGGRTLGYPDEPMVEIATDSMGAGLLHPWAGKIDRLIELGGLIYVEDHKAQPLHAKVLTPNGWSTIGMLAQGDYIIGANGQPTEVVGIYPQGDLQTYRVTFTDGRTTQCSLEHLWFVTDQFGKSEILTLQEIIQAAPSRKFNVPLPSPVDFDDKVLPIHPYLLGCLLGDGYIAGKAIQLSATDEHIIKYIGLICEQAELRFVKSGDDWKNNSWNIGVGIAENPVAKALGDLGLLGTKSETKFIPKVYRLAGIEQRLALLQGLMDTDGCVHDGIVTYTTVSDRLAVEMVELVRSLGGHATCRMLKKVENRQQAYKIHIRLPQSMCPFTMPRKVQGFGKGAERLRCYIKSIEATDTIEPHVCIMVEALDSLYITDEYIVTHNTTSRLDRNFYSGFELSNQFLGYTYLAQQLMPSAKVVGVRVNVYHCIKTQTTFERQLFTYTREQIEEWVRNTNAWMLRLGYDSQTWPKFQKEAEERGEAFYPLGHFGDNGCSRKYGLCQYHRVCSVAPAFRHRVLEEYPVEPWNPLNVED